MEYVVLLGVATGMRTMTALAVLSWCAWLGFVPEYSGVRWLGSLAAVVILTCMALGEYLVDVQPQTPSRTQFPLWAGRLLMAAFVGALAWRSVGQPLAGGVLMGLIGAAIGTWGGYRARVTVARWMGKDLRAGVLESAVALGFAALGGYALHRMLFHPAVTEVVVRHAWVTS